jgi:flagellar hook protein FlgE
MSLYGALFSGVSGLAAQSSAMGAISDNITNVNTTGYKGAKVNFQTLVTKQVSLTTYSAGGVQSKPRAAIDSQGLLQATTSSTDMALSGQGMFVVNTEPDPAGSGTGMFAYTRAGSFKLDKEGYLQNVSGFYLQGWPLTATDNSASARPSETEIDGNTYMKAYKDSTGNFHYVNQNVINPNEMKSLNLKTIGGTADPTTQIKMGANLPSGDSVFNPAVVGSGGLHETSLLIYDSLGNTSNLTLDWMKTNANQWDIANKTNFFGVGNAVSDSTKTPDTTATFSVAGQPAGGSATVITGSVAGHSTAFFAGTGVVAFETAADAALLPAGTNVTVSGSEDSANNGNFLIKTANSTSPATTSLNPGTMTVSRNGSSNTYASVTVAAGTITFGGTPKPTLTAAAPGGDIIQVTDSNGLTGYYMVTGYNAGTGVANVTALNYNNIDTAPYQTQRGIKPPAGSATLDIYDPTGASTAIYASQARLDFTASSRSDILAMNGKKFTVTPSGSSVAVTVEFYTGGVKNLYANPGNTSGSNIIIDLSNTSITSGAQVADLVAKSLSNSANWDATTNTYLPTTAVSTSTGQAIPLFRANGATVEVVQQTACSDNYTFDMSSLTGICTQAQTRQWNSSIPSVDTVTGQFVLHNIASSLANAPAVKFNGDGTPQAIMGQGSTTGSAATAPSPRISLTWANGAESMTSVPNGTGADHRITMFLGNTAQADGMTQLGGNYQLAYSTQNGAKFGNFSGVSVGSDGVVTALFDNGVRRPVFQIPVATFTNPNGMESLTGNSWIETNTSGTYTLRTANEAGAGSVQSASLEASTVDIGSEFTTMIVTQRAYSAAAKIITTADQMLDELVQIKR